MCTKPLVLAWLLLVVLTAVAGTSADLIGRAGLGYAPLFVVAAVTLAKVRLILSRYLQLGSQPGLLAGFSMATAFIVVAVTVSLVLP